MSGCIVTQYRKSYYMLSVLLLQVRINVAVKDVYLDVDSKTTTSDFLQQVSHCLCGYISVQNGKAYLFSKAEEYQYRLGLYSTHGREHK